MTMHNVNDDIMKVAALSLGGNARRISSLARWMVYSFGDLSFVSHGMRLPFDEPSVIERANNKLLSRDMLSGHDWTIAWRLIDTRAATNVSGGHEWVLKPLAGKKGAGVIARLSTEEVPDYCEVLGRDNRFLLLEPYVSGQKVRVLVLDDEVIGVSTHDAPLVTGDGIHTVRDLIDAMPERSPFSYGTRLACDTEVKHALKYQKMSDTAIPESGVHFYPTFVVNISRAATWKRVNTVQNSLEVILSMSKRASSRVGLRLAGVDVIIPKRGEPVILEVNPSPGIVGHTWDPDEKVVDLEPAQKIINSAIKCFGGKEIEHPKYRLLSLDEYLVVLNNGGYC